MPALTTDNIDLEQIHLHPDYFWDVEITGTYFIGSTIALNSSNQYVRAVGSAPTLRVLGVAIDRMRSRNLVRVHAGSFMRNSVDAITLADVGKVVKVASDNEITTVFAADEAISGAIVDIRKGKPIVAITPSVIVPLVYGIEYPEPGE